LRIFISAGEASGDLHAANLIRALVASQPGTEVAALGGSELEAAGARLLHNMLARFAVMGLVDALRVVPAIKKLRDETLGFLDSWRPDAAVLVDYPGFHINLALHLKKRGIPVIYYICPQVWAWGPWRIRKIARRIDRALVVLPFEKGIYEKAEIPVEYVGHPLGDVFASRGLDSEFVERGPLRGQGLLVSLLPGSRRQEIEAGFPVKARAAKIIKAAVPDATFAVPVTTDEHAALVRRIADDEGLSCDVFVGKTYEVMSMSKFALATSGTATLELAHFGVPMVVLYRTSAMGLLLKKLFVTTPHIALVNIVAGREIVPEFVYARDHADTIAGMALAVLKDPERLTRAGTDVRAVGALIDAPGASARAAEAVAGHIRSRSRREPGG
jgi:lipid-A-disaccharide synthase